MFPSRLTCRIWPPCRPSVGYHSDIAPSGEMCTMTSPCRRVSRRCELQLGSAGWFPDGGSAGGAVGEGRLSALTRGEEAVHDSALYLTLLCIVIHTDCQVPELRDLSDQIPNCYRRMGINSSFMEGGSREFAKMQSQCKQGYLLHETGQVGGYMHIVYV